MKLPFRRDEFISLIMFATPILITQLFLVGMGATDIAITGHFDTSVQAAVGLGVMIWNPLFLFTVGIMMSVAILSAHKYGAGRSEEVATIWHNGLVMGLFLIIFILVVMNLFVVDILKFFRAAPDLIPLSKRYLHALSLGTPALVVFVSLRCVCEGLSKPLPITMVAFVGFIVNGILNYILVNGIPALGIKSYGVVGSGIGTAIAIWVMLFLLIFIMRFDPRLRSLKLFSTRINLTKNLKELVRIGLPSGITTFAEVTIFSAAGLILGRYAEKVVASHQISLALTSITFMIPLSVTIALTALIGQRMGREDYRGVLRIGNMGRVTILGIMIITSILLFASRHHLPRLFNNDPIVIALSAKLIIYSIIFQLPDGLQISANGVLRGMKDTQIPMVLSIASYWLIAFPLCYYLGVTKAEAAEGVWTGLIIGLVFSAIFLNARLFMMNRRLKKTIFMKIEGERDERDSVAA